MCLRSSGYGHKISIFYAIKNFGREDLTIVDKSLTALSPNMVLILWHNRRVELLHAPQGIPRLTILSNG